MVDDLEIIRRVLEGDRNAFAMLVSRYQKAVYRLGWNLLQTHADAEELCQEVFLASFQALGRYSREQSKFSTWLLRIARNKALNHLQKKRPELKEELPTPSSNSTPVDESLEFRELMDRGLASLPNEQRVAFVLIELERYSYADASEIEQVAVGTMKSRVSRAKESLRQIFLALDEESARKTISSSAKAGESDE